MIQPISKQAQITIKILIVGVGLLCMSMFHNSGFTAGLVYGNETVYGSETIPENETIPATETATVTLTPMPTRTPAPAPPTPLPEDTIIIGMNTVPSQVEGPGANLQVVVTISNIGNTIIETLALTQTYDTTYLAYNTASFAIPPPDDDANDGQLNWGDITGIDELEPGESINVSINFVAQRETTGIPIQTPCSLSGQTCTTVRAGSPTSHLTGGTSARQGISIIAAQNAAISVIGDRIWFDQDSDGRQDSDEPGINGVHVNLWQAGELIDTAVTVDKPTNVPNAVPQPGYYSFEVQTSNTYTVALASGNFAIGGTLLGYSNTIGVWEVTPADTVINRDRIDLGVTIHGQLDVQVAVPSSSVLASDTIPMEITITNIGVAPLTAIPLEARYETSYLNLVSVTGFQPLNNTDDGVLNWFDIAPDGGLSPNESVRVVVNLQAWANTNKTAGIPPCEDFTVTCLTAAVRGAVADPDGDGPMSAMAFVPNTAGEQPLIITEPLIVQEEIGLATYLPIIMQ
ncbi:MAG: SdrD B-like domain-containing protein [Chloroflexota bacterium]